MTKGTWSKGKHNRKSHTMCIRCGRRAFHCKKKKCASCGYPDKKIRGFNWCTKALRRKKTGTGRMRYMSRAIKRRSNRERFERLFPQLKEAIINAQEKTGKRWAPKKEIIKQKIKLQKAKQLKNEARIKYLKEIMTEVKKRLGNDFLPNNDADVDIKQ
mmetsp:Transcript_89660/g.109753  ORF Transcript_89660/g.109753 Transcript_89660/m.109753 type:complete len:158 (-) Transcript_89660:130-603(-)